MAKSRSFNRDVQLGDDGELQFSKFCTHCGSTNRGDSDFCRVCGASFFDSLVITPPKADTKHKRQPARYFFPEPRREPVRKLRHGGAVETWIERHRSYGR